MKVSTLILTHNEAANLPACLEALSWCDDILVLDSGSTDDTVAVAKDYGARVMTRPLDNFATQRNYGMEMGELRHDWVLHLDADEIVTPDFVKVLQALEPPSTIAAYRVPSKLMLFGKWLRYAGMYPTYQVRIGKRDHLRFKQVGHGQREDLPGACVGIFDEPYLHFSFSQGMRRWLEKHVQYAADEAELILGSAVEHTHHSLFKGDTTERRRAGKERAAALPFFLRPALRFFYVYIFRQGFRDGHAGLVYSVMLSVYEGMIAAFGYEKELKKAQRVLSHGVVRSKSRRLSQQTSIFTRTRIKPMSGSHQTAQSARNDPET
jgi:glycosyltransferase involved in cell wall biosynthesis